MKVDGSMEVDGSTNLDSARWIRLTSSCQRTLTLGYINQLGLNFVVKMADEVNKFIVAESRDGRHARDKIVAKGNDDARVAGNIDGALYSLTKQSAIFAEVKEYFGIFNNQLGGHVFSKVESIFKNVWSN